MSAANAEKLIREQIAKNPILIYMKGTPDAPECGFSGAAVAALKRTGNAFGYVNVLGAPSIRERLPAVSRWPTFPQVFVQGELVGGCDIVLEMEADGSLKTLLDAATSAMENS